MIDISSKSVENCGFPEEYLFWVMMVCGIASPILAFGMKWGQSIIY